MPKVGKMKFPYTKKGMEDAQNYSKQSGKPMQVEGNYRHGGRIPKYNLGGMIPRRAPMGRPRAPMGRGMNPRALQALVQGLRNRFKKGGKVKK